MQVSTENTGIPTRKRIMLPSDNIQVYSKSGLKLANDKFQEYGFFWEQSQAIPIIS